MAAPGPTGISALSLGSALGTIAGSVLLAWCSLCRRRVLGWSSRWRVDWATAKISPVLDGFQSGVVNDSVTWLVVGLACIGGALALTLHG